MTSWSVAPTVAVVTAVALLLGACGDDGPATDGAGDDTTRRAVTVVLPNQHNLQWLNFWVARGAGYLDDEGLDVEVISPPAPFETVSYLTEGEAEVGILPPPMYLTAIGEGQPLIIVANLLRNDPINLVVQADVARERGIAADLPLAERLSAMEGLRVGVAPGPPTRLRVLFDTVGLDADRHLEVVVIHGEQQNDAFGEGRVDALYAHTPYLERAVVEQDAVTVVDQIGGEVPELSGFVRHALVTTEDYAAANRETLVALIRALHRAQQLIHTDPTATADAVRNSGVEILAPAGLETMITTYEPAIPDTPEVSVAGVRRNLEVLPAVLDPPDLSDEDLAAHVDQSVAREATAASS